MKKGITQAIRTDRLGLTNLLEKVAAAGLRFSDLFLRGQTFRLRVAGCSMSPALHTGDQITVEPAHQAQLQVGDIILIHHRGQLICHRVVALDTAGSGTRIITKGDAATASGEIIQPDQVLGKVVAVRERWFWAPGGDRVSALVMRIDRGREQLLHRMAKGLLYLQSLHGYRRIMRSFLSRSFAFYLGVPEGRPWISYQPISRGGDVTARVGYQGFHLLAKLGGSTVAGLQVVPRAEEYWLEALYVRIRYRGLGVASQLLRLACEIAVRGGARRLLAVPEQENQAARGLLAKTGFRPLPTSGVPASSVHVRDLARDLTASGMVTDPFDA